MSALTISVISSMATRQLLADLAADWQQRSGCVVKVESVGGVDAARRVEAGEGFDVVVLALDTINKLIKTGQIVADSKTDLVNSGVSVCVQAGAVLPDIGSETALKNTVLAAKSIGYSTGPSGVALVKLFEHWGISDRVLPHCVQAPAGVPVASLVARGDVELGFQQLSELLFVEGISIVGPLPEAVQINTTFSAGLCAASTQPDAVRQFLAFLLSPDTAEAKCRKGMLSA
ncbi:MAG: substrate-binding domain-containing protein [Pseudomonadota bacterium]